MDLDTASQRVREVDERDHRERADRLIELSDLLPGDDQMLGFSGQAGTWLFEDVKATWIYGAFAGTVVAAHAFCCIQIAGLIRLLPGDVELPETAESLEELAAIAVHSGAIDLEMQAALVELHDRYRSYTETGLRRHEARLERHLVEAESVGGEPPLLADARHALKTAVDVTYRRS